MYDSSTARTCQLRPMRRVDELLTAPLDVFDHERGLANLRVADHADLYSSSMNGSPVQWRGNHLDDDRVLLLGCSLGRFRLSGRARWSGSRLRGGRHCCSSCGSAVNGRLVGRRDPTGAHRLKGWVCPLDHHLGRLDLTSAPFCARTRALGPLSSSVHGSSLSQEPCRQTGVGRRGGEDRPERLVPFERGCLRAQLDRCTDPFASSKLSRMARIGRLARAGHGRRREPVDGEASNAARWRRR